MHPTEAPETIGAYAVLHEECDGTLERVEIPDSIRASRLLSPDSDADESSVGGHTMCRNEVAPVLIPGIYRWGESGLSLGQVTDLMRAAGRHLSVPLDERLDVVQYTKKLTDSGNVYVAVSDAGQPVGIMAFYANDQETREAFLSMLVLLPVARGLGLGTRLMSVLLEDCRTVGMSRIRLRVRTDNTIAMSLYRKVGFTVVDRVGDDYVMVAKVT